MANIKYDFRNMKIGDKLSVDYRGRNAAYVFRYYNPDFKFKSVTDGDRFIIERVE